MCNVCVLFFGYKCPLCTFLSLLCVHTCMQLCNTYNCVNLYIYWCKYVCMVCVFVSISVLCQCVTVSECINTCIFACVCACVHASICASLMVVPHVIKYSLQPVTSISSLRHASHLYLTSIGNIYCSSFIVPMISLVISFLLT